MMRHRQVLDQPVVQRLVDLELERADRVRDAFQGVALSMREVIHRVDAPRISGAVMVRAHDAVQHRVTQVRIRRRHVDLGAQRLGAISKLARAHASEQVEVLLHAARAVRAFLARTVQPAAVLGDLIDAQVADIRLAMLDEVLAVLVQLLEEVAGVVQRIPLKAQPTHIGLDRVDVLLLLLRRIGVVKAQVALAVVVLGQAEVDADRLGMPDVQVAVRLGWKARVHATFVGAVG